MRNAGKSPIPFDKANLVVRACGLCKGSHDLSHCDKFKRLSVGERKTYVTKERLCANCLKKGHALQPCPSKFKCIECKGSHHTLLHKDQAV